MSLHLLLAVALTIYLFRALSVTLEKFDSIDPRMPKKMPRRAKTMTMVQTMKVTTRTRKM